jgi:hypothetical protein
MIARLERRRLTEPDCVLIPLLAQPDENRDLRSMFCGNEEGDRVQNLDQR